MCAHRRISRTRRSSEKQGSTARPRRSRFIQNVRGSQAKNMRLIGTIFAVIILIFGGIHVIIMFSAGTFSALFGIRSASTSISIFLIFLIVSIIYLAVVIFFAFFWRTLFHAVGEHLEKMDEIKGQNEQIIELLEENLSKDQGAEIVEEKKIIQGSCPFCGHPVSSTHPGIHTCTNCKNRFQV